MCLLDCRKNQWIVEQSRVDLHFQFPSPSLGTGKLGAEELGGRNHVLQRWLHFGVFAGFQTTVRVHPQDVSLKNCKHLVDSVSNLFCRRYSWGVDVVNTRPDSCTVLHSLTEHGKELLVGTGVLNCDHIGIHVDDGVDNVIEVRVAHVGVNLSLSLLLLLVYTELVGDPDSWG